MGRGAGFGAVAPAGNGSVPGFVACLYWTLTVSRTVTLFCSGCT